jgi:hypothetical protein
MATGIKGRNMSSAISIDPPSVDLSVEIAITFPIHATGRISLRKRIENVKDMVREALDITMKHTKWRRIRIHTYLDQNK